MKPHRGNLLVVFGVLGLIVCPVFAVMTWIMAKADLLEMQMGSMDPEGESLTNIARILGIVGTLLAILTIVIILAVVVVMIAMVGMASANV